MAPEVEYIRPHRWDFPLFAIITFMEARKSKFKSVTQVRPDSKGRVTLRKLATGVSSTKPVALSNVVELSCKGLKELNRKS